MLILAACCPFTSLEIAPSKEAALSLAEASIRKGAFASGTRTWVIESSSVTEIERDLIERAAREVLGWNPPTS
jgi:2-keto-3-deoxy-6-phosphogluconate aldolase